MSIERQKMLTGEMYDPFDPELVAGRARARDLCQQLNATRESEEVERRRILRDLFGKGGDSVWMQPPFYCGRVDRPRVARPRSVPRLHESIPLPDLQEAKGCECHLPPNGSCDGITSREGLEGAPEHRRPRLGRHQPGPHLISTIAA